MRRGCEGPAAARDHAEIPLRMKNGSRLRVLCRDHNRLLAERDFGTAHISNAIAQSASNRIAGRETTSASQSKPDVADSPRSSP